MRAFSFPLDSKGLPKYHKAVMAVAIYVAFGYVIVMICLFAVWCRPLHYYYDVIPLPQTQGMRTIALPPATTTSASPADVLCLCLVQCMTYRRHMIFDACFNITSDAIMLCLPIPLVIRSQVPRTRYAINQSSFQQTLTINMH